MLGIGRFRLFVLAAACALLFPIGAIAHQHPGPAPADEYFGRFKESILGIRNHLNDFERKADRELAIGSLSGIDNLEEAVEDWHDQYPRDPWLPKFLDRLVRLYARAHNITHANAVRAIALLKHDYASTPFARDAFAVAQAEHKGQR